MIKKFALLLFFALSLSTELIAKSITNRGGLGCGKIVSMRETTQQSLPTELRDGYGGYKVMSSKVESTKLDISLYKAGRSTLQSRTLSI